MKNPMCNIFQTILACLIALAPASNAQEVQITPDNVAHGEPDYSPFIDQHFPTRVFWGDTHLHTANSPDAGLMGTELGPDAAYRFARGEEVTSNTGQRAKLARPLDFLVVSDHAGFYGVGPALKRGDEAILADPKGREWYDAFNSGPEEAHRAALDIVINYMLAARDWPPASGMVRSRS